MTGIPHVSGTAAGLDEAVAQALARGGWIVHSWSRLSRRRVAAADRRVTYRLELADGRVVKARRCSDEARAREVWRIRRSLALDGIARVYAQDGPVLIEEWIEGTPLAPTDGAPADVAQSARILARLHGSDRIGDLAVPSMMTTADWLGRATGDLGLLAERHAVPGEALRVLGDALARAHQETAVVGVIHRDACAENMVRRPDGGIVLVDNEWLSIGPPAYDLGRVWWRWPLSPSSWSLFLDTYAAERGPDLSDASLLAWKIAATTHSAVVRLALDPGRLAEPLARLRELAESVGSAG